jgi:hypothetical protein
MKYDPPFSNEKFFLLVGFAFAAIISDAISMSIISLRGTNTKEVLGLIACSGNS